jgi:hypothetical protein
MPATATKRLTRTELIGHETHWKVSDLGVHQRPHDYSEDILATILAKALKLKTDQSQRRHLNLRFIPAAHRLIPEILDIVHWPGRLETVSEAAGVELEPYPISVIAATITFMGADRADGVIDWHTDGVPITEIIPLEISADALGGDLRVFRGNHDEGMARLDRGDNFDETELARFSHRIDHSTLAQLMRVLHSTEPMLLGTRISLNLNLRSAVDPFIDDNSIYYLGADNPSLNWVDEYIDDVRQRQLPAYKARRR